MFTSSDFNALIKINSLTHAAALDWMPSFFSCDDDDDEPWILLTIITFQSFYFYRQLARDYSTLSRIFNFKIRLFYLVSAQQIFKEEICRFLCEEKKKISWMS